MTGQKQRIGEYVFVIHRRDTFDGIGRERNGEWLADWGPSEFVLAQACDENGEPFRSFWIGFLRDGEWKGSQTILMDLGNAYSVHDDTYQYQLMALARAQLAERVRRRAAG